MRLLTVLGGYAFAAVFGTIVTLVGLAFYFNVHFIHLDWLAQTSFLVFIVALLLGVIPAIPVLVFSEIQSLFGSAWVRHWFVYTLTGAVWGSMLLIFFSHWNDFSHWSELLEPLILVVSTSAAGFGYWLFAWKLFPPKSFGSRQRHIAS
ncbi:hypothetical protein [Qipengyuania sp. ASV99]|uniref:hypothetical protein n=1 Tax=Qipengyuania sp. ASV99 TaxID=3399681 RepID=UPI003A4C667E